MTIATRSSRVRRTRRRIGGDTGERGPRGMVIPRGGEPVWDGHPPGSERQWALAFDQADFTRPRTLAGFLGRELYPLALAEELEHRATYGAAVKEVLDTPFVADKSEPLVDQKPSNRPGWHGPCPPPMRVAHGTTGNIPSCHTLSLKRRQCREIPMKKSTNRLADSMARWCHASFSRRGRRPGWGGPRPC